MSRPTKAHHPVGPENEVRVSITSLSDEQRKQRGLADDWVTFEADEILVPVHWVVVHETVGEDIKRRVDVLAKLFPVGSHPLAKDRVIHSVTKVDQSSVLVQ